MNKMDKKGLIGHLVIIILVVVGGYFSLKYFRII